MMTGSHAKHEVRLAIENLCMESTDNILCYCGHISYVIALVNELYFELILARLIDYIFLLELCAF